MTKRIFFLFILLQAGCCFAAVPGQLMVDQNNKSWLFYNRDTDGNGKPDPAFICGPGDPENFFYRGVRNPDGTRSGDQQILISNMILHGVNSIYMQVIRSHGGDGDSSHNPFIQSNPALGLDEDILNQWDGWLTQLDQAGIVIYFFFYDDSARIWSGDAVGNDELSLINTLVNRYKHLKHLVWVVAEEYSERYSVARVSNIAAAIKAADNNSHPVANHQLSSIIFDHATDPSLDQFALQYNNTTVDGLHEGMVKAWKNAGGRYSVMMAETSGHGDETRTICRRKNWAGAMGGAYVMVLGMDGSAAYNEKMTDCKTLRRFFESTDFNTMAPHDELGNDGTWVLADPGSSYVAYRYTAGPFVLDGLQGGTYQVTWLDTVSGASVKSTVSTASASYSFLRPTSVGSEAAVWVHKTGEVESPQPSEGSHPSVAPMNYLLLKESR